MVSLRQRVLRLLDNKQEREAILLGLTDLKEWPDEYQSVLQEDYLLQHGPWAMDGLSKLEPTDDWLVNILKRVLLNIALYGDETTSGEKDFAQVVENFHRERPITKHYGPEFKGPPKKPWTVLVYSNQFDNSCFSFNDIKQGESLINEENVNIVYCMRRQDWSKEPKNPMKKWCWITRADGNWSGLRYYKVLKGAKPYYELNSEVLYETPEVDLDDTTHLANFISWAVPKFPAQRYCLSIWNHGSHVTGKTLDSASANNSSLDKLGHDLRDAWKQVEPDKPISLLLLNSCNLATVEVLAEFAPVTDFAYACQTRNNTPGDGCFYEWISNEPTIDSKELLQRYFSVQSKASLHCYERNGIKTAFSATAYDLRKMEAILAQFKALAQCILKCNLEDRHFEDMLPADEAPFINLEFDLLELLERMAKIDGAIGTRASSFIEVLRGKDSPIVEHMVNEHIDWVHGLSVLFNRPVTIKKLKELKKSDDVPLPGPSYGKTRFEQITGWLKSHQGS